MVDGNEPLNSTEKEAPFYLSISENGLKSLTGDKILYTSKFHKIQWSCDPNYELPIKVNREMGPGSEVPITMSQAFLATSARLQQKLCLQYIQDPRGSVEASEPDAPRADYKPIKQKQAKIYQYTWEVFYQMSMHFAKALANLGVSERSCVMIQGINSPEHLASIMGTVLANCIFTDVYMTNSPDICLKQVKETGTKIIVCDTYKRLKTTFLDAHSQELADAGVIACFLFAEGTSSESAGLSYKSTKRFKIYNWSQVMQLGHEVDDRDIFKRIERQRPGMCCNIVWTSGTTGDAKGVMLSHDNMTWFWSSYNQQKYGQETQEGVAQDGTPQQSEEEWPPIRVVSFLPFSHITAQMADLSRLIISRRPMQLTFAGPRYVNENLHEVFKIVKPTDLIAVPRIYEKWQSFIQMSVSNWSPTFKALYKWAIGLGWQNTLAQQKGDLAPFGYGMSKVLILQRLKQELGLDHIENMYYGAAPMAQETRDFYARLNMPVISLYGLSETSAACTFHEFPNCDLNKAGQPMPGVKLRIYNPDESGEGEICVRGRNVFMGYMHREKATWEVFDSEGYFHTGDKGKLDESNYLVITGRIKEILITSGGENVEPQAIEQAVKVACPLVSHAVLVGDGRKFVSVLLTLKVEKDPQLGVFTKKLAVDARSVIKQKLGMSNIQTVDDILNTPEVMTYIQECVNQANQQAINRVSKIKKWLIMPNEFDVLTGELTPTFKVKRKYINKKFEAKIEMLYAEPKL